MRNILQMLVTSSNQLKGLTLLLLVTFLSYGASAQTRTITGKVIDGKNETLPGVSVLIKGTSSGTITDADGNYSLSAEEGDILQFSYIGYATQLISISGGRSKIDLTLQEDIAQLEEIVVVGYGTQKKSHLTGSISKVTNEKLDQIPAARADEALVGQVSGVQIASTSEGGVGSDPTIRIRGVGSITAGAGPLLVIDGVAVDSDFFGNIDMNDVESFEVLKDAASAAIFGSRGGNGVIMITTKQGKEGRTKFSYNGFFGVQDVARNDDYNTSVADWLAEEQAVTGELSDGSRYKQLIGVDNDWQDVFFDGGTVNSHSISARGGTKKTKFSTSATYLHDEGVLLTDDFKKYNFKVKVDTDVSDQFSFGISLNPSYTNRRRFDGSTHNVLRHPAWLPIYHDEYTIQFVDKGSFPDVQIGDYAAQAHFNNYDLDGDGTLVNIRNSGDANPYARVAEREYRDRKFKLFGQVYGNYKFTDDFSLRVSFAGSMQDNQRTRWQGTLYNSGGAGAAESLFQSNNAFNIVTNSFFSYNKAIGNHEISAIAGISTEQRQQRVSEITGSGYDFDFIETINAATLINDADSYEREKRLFSYVGRVNYAYNNKYLASLSIRRDGSSVFGPDSKYGNFPAASFGWRISEEDFLSGSSLISNLKLRVSYGITGNDNIDSGDQLVDWYAYEALLGAETAIIDGEITSAYNPINIANPDLQWERSIEFNPAIDFGILDNRISGSVDYYKRTSDALLLGIPVSGVTGFQEALVNIGEVTNEGFEFELRSNNLRTSKFSWTTTALASINTNTLTDFADADGLITNVDEKRAAEWISSVGNPISAFYGYVTDREIPVEYLNDHYRVIGAEAQDVYVKDLNGDGVIDGDDRTIIGDPYPDLIWSITNSFEYGNFDMSFMFQGSHGADVRNIADQYLYNQFSSSQDFDPDITPDQEFIQQKIFTDHIVQDASYVALRNVNIGYSLPKSVLEKVGLFKARVYVSGQNLLYMKSSEYTGFNPESIRDEGPINYGYNRGGAPIPRKVVVGVNMDF